MIIELNRGLDRFILDIEDDEITIKGDWRMLLSDKLIAKIDDQLIEDGYFDEDGNIIPITMDACQVVKEANLRR